MEEDSKGTPLGNVIRIDDERVREHLGRVVRGTVEETLNAMLEAEADRLCNAGRYERTEARRDQRSGSYDHKLQTQAGEVRLKIPKLRRETFETAIIERYRRRESSVEEALIEMYLAGVSVRRVEDITEALWGTRVSPSTVSNLNKGIYSQIEAWRHQPIEGEQPISISTASCSSAAGPARCATSRCWWRFRSMTRATGRSSASSRVPRKTRPAGVPS
jgi:putative transposase